jgi:fermentation-respiration switch protein FrsA (DUF1100 family)
MSRGSALALLVVSLLACAPEARAPVAFVVPSGQEAFLDAPWPSDLFVTPDGLDLHSFPNPYGSVALFDVIRLFETNDAFAATQTMYFRVPDGVDEASLPASPKESMTSDAMFLIELASKRRIPLDHTVYPDGTDFLPPGTVALMPLLGAVPDGAFALVVTSAAKSKGGARLGPSGHMRALMTCEAIDAPRAPDCAPYQEVAAWAEAELGLAIDDIALISVTTPKDATATLRKANALLRSAPVPRVKSIVKRTDDAYEDYVVYDGVVSLTQFQAGRPPYDVLDHRSGGFVLDDDGTPIPQRDEDVPFILTVPKGGVPDAGFPVVINGHGTGGDLESGLGNGAGDTAWELARIDTAMLSVSEPLHFTRAGYREGQEDILTFNFFNPLAGRDNWRQSALEKVQLVTLAMNLVVPAENRGSARVRLDANNVGYFGHSQGGIVGALVIGVEDRINAAFLSGAGAGFGPSLVEKEDPVKIIDVLKLVLLMPEDEDVDIFHPVISLLQSYVDPADPINYGRAWRNQRGRVPHLLATSGLLDTFTPPRQHEGLAGAFGLPIAAPVEQPIEVLELLDIEDTGNTVEGNLETRDGAPLTAALFQYADHGHFAVFNDAGCQAALRFFFQTAHEEDGLAVPRVQHQ